MSKETFSIELRGKMKANLFWILGLTLLLFGGPLYATCLQPQRLTGVNMAGAAFGSSKLPGRMNRDYTYREQSQLAYFAANGSNVIWLPIRWERIQRKLFHELNSQELHAIKTTVAQARADNLIMVAGGRWSGIHDWSHPGPVGVSNAVAFAALDDPLTCTMIEVHQYADQNYSGTHAKCRPPDDFDSMFTALTQWTRANDQQLLLGEFGVPPKSECLKTLKRLVVLTESPQAWQGWTYWAAGGWLGRYPFSVAPVDGKNAPQRAILSMHFFNNTNHRSASDTGADHG